MPGAVGAPARLGAMAILNLAAYRFTALEDLPALQACLQTAAGSAGLKGTILLAPEGINLFLAGAAQPLRTFQRDLAQITGSASLDHLQGKESWSEAVPFRRLRVRIKREIIRMDHPAIRPADGRARAVAPPDLARWIAQGQDDAGRPLLLLDTRNRFEVEAGRFTGALDLGIDRFTQFPAAVQAQLPQLAGHTVVSYCTGGIRCEKASLYLDTLGLEHHYQLDGGILAYFEQVGARGYEGDCTVFDDRSAVAPDLSPALDGPAVS